MIPFFDDDFVQDFAETSLPTRTCRVDFERDIARGFDLDGIAAIKQTIFLILSVERYEYEIYSWRYGVELQNLIGMPVPLVYAKIRNVITDALLQDDRIFRVHGFRFERDGPMVKATFLVDTEHGLVEAERLVRIAA